MGSQRHKHARCSNLWFGIFILAAGFFWLLDRMDLIFVHWIFSWKLFLIGFGVLIGIKKRFRGIGWMIPILVGTVFILEDVPALHFEVRQYGFPLLIIAVGFLIVYRALTSRSRVENQTKNNPLTSSRVVGSSDATTSASSEDVIDISNLFGSTKKKIFSKSFKGGKIKTTFGSTELDLSQADIDGIVTIDIDQTFGGFELIVPGNWEVKTEVNLILAGIEELRTNVVPSPTIKVLVLTGSCTLSGIEIKSYN